MQAQAAGRDRRAPRARGLQPGQFMTESKFTAMRSATSMPASRRMAWTQDEATPQQERLYGQLDQAEGG